ncbi:MAG: site-specific DNA-methyltransferase, partial [Synergistaceae bacterium]|nr:site-specific DNA-methyltransferase [Synergistaceae bacterium]
GRTRGYSPRHDDILFFTKDRENFTFNLDAVRVPQKYYRMRNNMKGANPGNVWEFSHVHYCSSGRMNHPTQKPEALFERMILASSDRGDTVLDPFVGSGTSLRVCQQTGRHAIGIDINPEYVDMTLERLAGDFNGFDSSDTRIDRIPKDMKHEYTGQISIF